MPAPLYTTDNFLEEVRVLGSLPSNNEYLNDDKLLILMNHEMKATALPELMNTQAEYLVAVTTVDLTENIVSIPGNSVATKLRYVKITQPGQTVGYNLPQLDPAKTLTYPTSGNVYGFFLRANKIVLHPEQSSFPSGGELEIAYYVSPNKLVSTDRCGQVTAINTSTNVVTLDQLPAQFEVGDDACALDSQPPYDLRFVSREITLISSPNVRLDSVEDLEVGDFVCSEGESCVIQLPQELIRILVQATIVKAQESIADPRWRESKAVLQEELTNWRHMAKDRVKGNPIIFSGQNGVDGWGGAGPWGVWSS